MIPGKQGKQGEKGDKGEKGDMGLMGPKHPMDKVVNEVIEEMQRRGIAPLPKMSENEASIFSHLKSLISKK